MDPTYIIDEPNKVADVYRNYRPAVLPFEIEKRLDFIDCTDDGYSIIGSSSLSGRYWRGSVWYFKNASLAPKKENCDAGVDCKTSVSDGKFIGNKETIIIGEDSGAVTIYKLVEDEDKLLRFEGHNSKNDHDDCVLSISVSPDKTNAVTAGMDRCIKVLDLQELVAVHTFHNAHGHHVTSVGHQSDSSSKLFGSCGLDGSALIWDTRQPKPATVLVDNPAEGLTAFEWLCGNVNTLAIGSAFGAVSIFDIRACASLKQATPADRSIYKLLSVYPSSLAVCSDSIEMKVVDPFSENLTMRYTDRRHKDFIRGLSFDPKSATLFSCGWDQQVLSHSLFTEDTIPVGCKPLEKK